MSVNFCYFVVYVFKLLFDKCFQGLVFCFVGDDEVVQCVVKSGQNVGGDGVEILFFGGYYVWLVQDINWVDFFFIVLYFYLVGSVYQLFSQFFVEDEFILSVGILFKM